MAKNSEIKRSSKQSEGPQGSYPGTGPDPNEIANHSDGVYDVQAGRFLDAEDGYGEGQIHIREQQATSADTYPQAGDDNIENQQTGHTEDEENEL